MNDPFEYLVEYDDIYGEQNFLDGKKEELAKLKEFDSELDKLEKLEELMEQAKNEKNHYPDGYLIIKEQAKADRIWIREQIKIKEKEIFG